MNGTILIVDDSVSIRQLMTFTLRDAGYSVVEAANGPDALSKAASGDIDMVITDLHMPDMDGIELITRMKTFPQFRYKPFLMLTTESQETKKQEGREAGACGWIVKPFAPEQLVKVVQKFIK
ncbi:MAG: response regulator [Nitrospirota bacterium]|jgi:two-component system chemotaxis response regulator CheY